ncbi:AttF component of AttEFGH ABC transport system / AttG component of AttEFGH ABC transport system [Roseibacterium elongatum DSM 19469]|uniref:AttF component of AttEFGH ABC transport system / AttG component of AttEFGH ABC transport system n=2 Tax=Roseicyclus elongatus TaxID=159346 RepID=W8RZZ1_9RHOB|nr:AttF component of AttEFGH ABC transport system / AttG component of AttEFGH ABC transport system [Roseibacterium elongatum DSM 19469]
MLYTALQSLFSHWRRRPGQLAMLALGLALATALWSGVQAINAEARASYDRAAQTLGQDSLSRLSRADGQPVPLAEFLALRQAGYQVSPVIAGELRTADARLRVQGIDSLTAPAEAQGPALDGDLDLAAFFTAPGILIVSPDTAAGPLPPGLPPLRLSDGMPPGAALTDISTAARLIGQDDPSFLLVAPEQPAGLPPLSDVTDLIVTQPQEASDIGRLTDSFHLNLTAFGLLSFAVGLFIVHAAIGLAFEQRRSSFRTLRAIGLPLRSLLLALAVEIAAIALVSGLVGVVLGYAIAAALMPGVAGTLSGLYGANVPGTLSFDPVWAISALGITLVGAGAAAAQAMLRTARMPILSPAQPRAWAQASARTIRAQGLAAVALLAASGGLILFGTGLLTGFAALAALLVGAALALPVLLTWALKTVETRVHGPFSQWVLADMRQQIPGLSLALMALLLALAANIGVSTMVGSFRATFLGWLDQRLASELYVRANDPTQAGEIAAWLDPRAQAVLPIVSTDLRLFGLPGDVFGMADHATYRDHWPLLDATDDTWDRLFSGEVALVNEQLARREGLRLGDPVMLSEALTLPIGGVYSDYGNPTGQVILGLDLFRASFPAVDVSNFAIRIPPAQAPDLASDLRETFGLPAEAVRNQAQIKRFSIDVFEQTFRVTGALNVLTLGVAGLALLTSLLTLATMRLPQLAPVWAVGLPRRILAGTELARSLVLAALTWLLALPVGVALAWVLLAVVNVEAFGWRLPLQVFPGDWLRLFLLSLLAASLAALLPALRLARIPPARLLQVFAQER